MSEEGPIPCFWCGAPVNSYEAPPCCDGRAAGLNKPLQDCTVGELQQVAEAIGESLFVGPLSGTARARLPTPAELAATPAGTSWIGWGREPGAEEGVIFHFFTEQGAEPGLPENLAGLVDVRCRCVDLTGLPRWWPVVD